MRFIGIVVAVAASVFAVYGCTIEGTPAGGRQFPEPTPGFSPKVTYAADPNRVWAATMSALTANNIAIASSSREAGQITTEYVPGQITSYGPGGLGGTGDSRYKYNFFIVPAGTQTRLNIRAVLESSLTGGSTNATTGFRDLSDQNPRIVDMLQNWMYEQVERKI